jgi:hypothetical protein
MRKFWRGFRKASDLREREERKAARNELILKLLHLLRTGSHEAVDEYAGIVKDLNPDVTEEELREQIKRYHAAVNERQSLDRGRY